jgi:hypothetical protein
MNVLAKFIIYPQVISDDIPKLGLISVKKFPITTLPMVVEPKTGLVPPRVEALIQMKIIVGLTNKVSIMIDHQAIETHLAYFSTLFTRYSSIDHFEMIEARVLKLHKKINICGEHVYLFKMVNLAGASLSALLISALVRGYLLNQFVSFLNTKSEERTSRSSIYMLPG